MIKYLRGSGIYVVAGFWVAYLATLGCRDGNPTRLKLPDYVATHESARFGLPIAVEFEELFPDEADHFITHFALTKNSGKEELTWNSLAYFGGRYSLQMEMPVIVDYDMQSVTRAGEPVFGLAEFTRVEDLGGGQISGHSRTAAIFGEAEWDKIYKSGGDFTVVKVDIESTGPIPGFDKLIRAARQPLVPISLIRK